MSKNIFIELLELAAFGIVAVIGYIIAALASGAAIGFFAGAIVMGYKLITSI